MKNVFKFPDIRLWLALSKKTLYVNPVSLLVNKHLLMFVLFIIKLLQGVIKYEN